MKIKRRFLLFVCFLFLTYLHAKAELINAVSIIVEKEPITLFEIYKFSKMYNLSTKDAMEVLVRQKLELSQIKTMGIEISDFDINKQFREIATKNNMSENELISALISQNIDIDSYKNEIRKNAQREKLYQYIFREKFQTISKDEVKKYYESNKNEFTKIESFDVTRLSSNNFDALNQITSLMAKNDEVESTRIRLYSTSTEARIINLLTKTNQGSITPIIETKDGYEKFIVHKKTNESILPFEQVENIIMQKISQDKERSIIEDYFEKLKSRSSITVIRLP